MKGFGSYNDWAYYATPPSNLSAFATPFSVNRPISGDVSFPFVDSADAVYPNSLHSRSYGYDYLSDPIAELNSSIPSSNPYNGYSYSGSQVLEPSGAQFPHMGQCSNSTKPSPVEAQPYFHSYASPAVHDHTSSSSVVPNHWSSFSGFTSLDGSSLGAFADKSPELGFAGQSANQFAEFNHAKGKSVGVGSSFSSNCSSNQPNITGSVVEERMNLGYQDIKDNHGGVPHMIDWVKHSVPTSADQLDDKSCWWSTVKPTPVEFSGTSVLQSSSLSLETHHEAPLKLAVDSGNHCFSYTGVYDKDSRQQEEPSRVDTVSSTPISGSVTDLNIGNIVADGDVGHNNFFNIKEAYPMPSPGAAGCFDLGHLRMHLERNEPSSSNNTMISDRNVSGDAVDYIHKARHGIQNPHPRLGSLSLRFSATEDVNSIEKSFLCGDLCNPAVDSPCWKGAPTARIFHNESSEALPPEHVRKIEECFGSVIQEAQNFLRDRESNVKKSYDGSNSCQMYIGIVDEETSSAGSTRKFSETKFASEDCKSYDAVNAGRFQSEPSCDFGLQNLADVTEMKETSVPPTKPIDCESGSSHNEHQVIKENILVSQKSHTLCIGGADAGCNENECFESSTSLTAEHALSSPSSVADAPTTPEKSAEKVSTGKLNVQMLVDTMQNLSELLLNHCINDACELKERDSDILRNVISNLNTCVLNDAEQFSPAKKCLLHQLETSRCAGEPCKLPQNELKANLHFGSGKPHWKLSDSISPRGDAETTKAEKMTKALKKILSENFDDDEATESQTVLYKNLWLEAEAALCSVNYKARYNQMKIEMEKHSYKQRDMEEQSKDEVIPSLSKSQNSETKVHNNPNSDSSGLDSPVLDATNPKAVLKFSIDMNKPNPLAPEGEGRQDLNSFVQNYTVSGTNKETAGNDEASVMARYRVLISRGNVMDLDKPSDIADKMAASVIDNQNQVNFCQDSPVPGENKADYEASVLARFHILKSRVEDSSSLSSKEKWMDGVGSSVNGIEDAIITENAPEGKNLDAHLNSQTAVDKSIPKEIHLDLEDQEELQPCRSYEFHLPSHLSDGFASDWEHV